MALVPLLNFKNSKLFVRLRKLILTEIEKYIIDKIKTMRKEHGISQLSLSQKLDMNDSFISHVESNSKRTKYNINHLNLIAKIFNCSPRDFWPDKGI